MMRAYKYLRQQQQQLLSLLLSVHVKSSPITGSNRAHSTGMGCCQRRQFFMLLSRPRVYCTFTFLGHPRSFRA